MADIQYKKQKLVESSVNHLTAMEDDLITEILNWLDLRSLCAISQTCNKLRQLAATEFHKKYPNAFITLAEKNEQVCVEAIAPHIQCFSRIIGNLYIKCSKKDKQLISAYLQSNYGDRVFSGIKFSGEFSGSFGTQIQNTLRTVESVDISQTSRGYKSILTQCQSVKQLLLNWRQLESIKYPSLEHLKIDLNGKTFQIFEDKLNEFMQLNSTIKHFECTTHATNINELVNLLVKHCRNLEIVSLNAQIHHIFRVTELLSEPLKKLDELESVKEIRLATDRASNVNALASHTLKKLTHLRLNYYFSFGVHHRVFGELDLFTNVQFLFLRCFEITFNASDMAKKLPNLKEIHLSNCQRHFDAFKEVIMPFLTFSPKLQKIVALDNFNLDITTIELYQDERACLLPASNLSIYISEDICNRQKQLIETFNQKFNTVNIRPTKFTVAPPFTENTGFNLYYE